MESEKEILTFIKAIDKQYFDSFIENGEICMNTIKWFRDYEKIDSNIGDGFEGANFVCGHDFTIEFADPITEYSSKEELNKKIKSANWVTIGKGIDLKGINEGQNANIFSLYVLSMKKNDEFEGHLASPKFTDEFDNHRFVIFLDPMAFISKMKNKIFELKKTLKSGVVNYYKLDENLINDLSYFHKPEKYSYQNEFRFVIEDSNAIQQIIRIGSLTDICIEIDIRKEHIISFIGENQFSIKQKD